MADQPGISGGFSIVDNVGNVVDPGQAPQPEPQNPPAPQAQPQPSNSGAAAGGQPRPVRAIVEPAPPVPINDGGNAQVNNTPPGYNTVGVVPSLPQSIPILAKMILEPYSRILPRSNAKLLPKKQTIISHRQNATQAATADMADPLILYSIHSELDEKLAFGYEPIVAPAEYVSVTNVQSSRSFVPKLTEVGEEMMASLSNPIGDTATIRSMIPPPPVGARYFQAVLANWQASSDQVVYHEEAMPLRLMCLLQSIMPNSWYESKTQLLLSLNFFGDGYEFDTQMIAKTLDADDDTSLQIGSSVGTSNLYIMTLKKFVFSRMNHTAGWGDDAVIIPVRVSWLNEYWLIVYILGFTTTRWWNHAYRYKWFLNDTRFVSGNSAKPDGQQKMLWVSAYPKGCTVVIDGAHKDIVLVVMDDVSGPTEGYTKGKMKYEWLMGEEFDLAKQPFTNMANIFYHLLGRKPGTFTNGFTVDEELIKQALKHFVSHLSNAANMQKVNTYCAMLLGTFTAGYTVSTKLGSGDFSGVRNFNINRDGSDNKIAKGTVPDMTKPEGDEDFVDQLLGQWAFWRVNCLGMFSHSSVRIGNGKGYDENRTMLHSWKNAIPYWNVTTMSPDARLLMHSNVFANYQNTYGSWPQETAYYLFNYISAHSSMLAGITNWALAETGTTLMDANKMTSLYTKEYHSSFMDVIQTITGNFFDKSIHLRGSFTRTDEFEKIFRMVTSSSKKRKYLYDEYYGLFLPYWYVQGLIKKFGVAVKVVTDGTSEVAWNEDDEDEDDDPGAANGTREVYDCSYGVGNWSDMNMMTCTLTYEKRQTNMSRGLFRINFPNRTWTNHGPTLMPWFPYTLNDNQRFDLRDYKKTMRPRPLTVKNGVIETMMMVRPDSRMGWCSNNNPNVYIDEMCSQKRDIRDTWYDVVVILPDPVWDWITSGVMNIAPFLLRGDLHGAALATGVYIADTGYQWLTNLFRQRNDAAEHVGQDDHD